MTNHSAGFATEGYKASDGSARVTIRGPSKLWSAPADYTLTRLETLKLIQSLAEALEEADAQIDAAPMEDVDPSPDCRCETCPQGGPYTCISAD